MKANFTKQSVAGFTRVLSALLAVVGKSAEDCFLRKVPERQL